MHGGRFESKVELVIFDMAGTTVNDVIDGVPLVLKSYDEAFRRYGVEVPMKILNEQRGRDKLTVIREFGGEKAQEIFDFFFEVLMENTGRVKEMPGACETFKSLRELGVKIALNTGFPKEVAKGIIENLGWKRNKIIDFWICSEMVGISRPDPAMILEIMERLGIKDTKKVVKVDDTAKGIEEGLRADVITIGVITGTQSRERLEAANPADIISNVAQIVPYLHDRGLLPTRAHAQC
jgi:phosphonatase-like hydrolase